MTSPAPRSSPFDLTGRRAVVTGASRGLGAAMAVALAEAGAYVLLVARGDCTATAEAVRATGRRAGICTADLAEAEAAERVLAAAVAQFGGADILVNNAGVIRRAPLLEFSDDDWDEVINVNLRACFRLARGFARHCVAEGRSGKIINIASLLSFQGGVRVVSYAAAKSGLLGLTRAMANELAPQCINVNAIAPGYIATDNTAALRADPVRHAAILERIPAGRCGVPADLGGAAVFLAAAAAYYVHGAVLPVDGGWLAR